MRVAVAGLGWWGKHIIRCLARGSRFEVLYGIDPMPPDGTAEFAREFHVKLEADLGTALRDPAVEGIILATPHALHEEQILAVLAAGKNVFCEKPLTMTSAGAARVIAACDKAGKVLGIGHEHRFEPAFEEVARLVSSGALGRILYMDANYSHDQFRHLDSSNWRLSSTHAPAGMMTAVGMHLTDLFIVFVGPPTEVRAQTATMVLQPPAEDFVGTNIIFKSGTRASINLLSVTPFYGRFSIYGDAGWVEITNEANVDRGKPTILTRSIRGERHTQAYEDTDTVTLNFEAWDDAVAGRRPYRYTSEQLLANIRLLEAIVTSSRQDGQAVAL
jgi:predicted dehydrogenase